MSVDNEESLIDPSEVGDGSIPYPKALSPSAIMEFKKCPQSFLFQYLYKMRQPTSLALAKGSMCHSALEQIFDLDPEDRTLPILQDLYRAEWAQHRKSDSYRILFETVDGENDDSNWDIDAERDWGKSALQLLENYYELEDPSAVTRPNPVKREIWLNAHLSVDPSLGASAANGGKQMYEKMPGENKDIPTFHVRGIVDRLDMIRTTDAPSRVSLRIVDYKTGKSGNISNGRTVASNFCFREASSLLSSIIVCYNIGKAPNLKYSKAMNEKIQEEAFFQLKIYALLLREKGAGKAFEFDPNELDLRLLRLLYLNSVSGKAVNWDLDMGATPQERDAVLQDVHTEISNVWVDIVELVSMQDPKAFVGCDRSFCYCHKCRTTFVPGTVWEPPSP